MTFPERNDMINDLFIEAKAIHDHYTNKAKILTDEEWEQYIHDMDSIAEKHKQTNINEISWKLVQALLDDTELIQKKLREVEHEKKQH